MVILRNRIVPCAFSEIVMKTEHEKMLAGELYDPMDADLVLSLIHI